MEQPSSLESDETEAAQWIPIDRLSPWPNNPRKIDDTTIRRVARNMRELGWGAPVLARQATGEIVAGHTRIKAADRLVSAWGKASERARTKWHPDAVRVATKREVPVRFGDWSEREAHLMALADNRLAEGAQWDDDALKDVMEDFEVEELDVAGWDVKELEKLGFNSEFDELDGEGGADMTMTDGLTYSVIVDFDDEAEQAKLLEELEGRGLRCRLLIT